MSGGASGPPAATGQRTELTRHESRSRVGIEPVRCMLESAALVVGEVNVGGGDVDLELFHTGCAGNRGHGQVADDPGQRYLGRRGGMRPRPP